MLHINLMRNYTQNTNIFPLKIDSFNTSFQTVKILPAPDDFSQ